MQISRMGGVLEWYLSRVRLCYGHPSPSRVSRLVHLDHAFRSYGLIGGLFPSTRWSIFLSSSPSPSSTTLSSFHLTSLILLPRQFPRSCARHLGSVPPVQLGECHGSLAVGPRKINESDGQRHFLPHHRSRASSDTSSSSSKSEDRLTLVDISGLVNQAITMLFRF